MRSRSVHCNEPRFYADILTCFESIHEINYWIGDTHSWFTHVCMGDLNTCAESIQEMSLRVTQADRNLSLYFFTPTGRINRKHWNVLNVLKCSCFVTLIWTKCCLTGKELRVVIKHIRVRDREPNVTTVWLCSDSLLCFFPMFNSFCYHLDSSAFSISFSSTLCIVFYIIHCLLLTHKHTRTKPFG